MADSVLTVRGLGKRYRIGARQPYATLRDALSGAFSPSAWTSHAGRADEHVWAIRDVTFDVRRGEVVGLIGRNGAGKSTLLKVLAGITEPTEGRAEAAGRVGALLEVGTGFHPELTGRENIYLNGAILGMRRSEIDREFDSIVGFAEVGRFLDTPVKHYSSGMGLRLGFAVAAFFAPEILFVDEVLAVGDAQFQKKCLGKMGEVAASGRTVLFVSHNMTAVERLCERVILLEQGRIAADGPASQVVSRYARTAFSPQVEQVWPDIAGAPGNDKVRIRLACVRPAEGAPSDPITVRTPFVVEFEYWNLQGGARLNLAVPMFDERGNMLFTTAPICEPDWNGRLFPSGLFRSSFQVPGDILNDGPVRVDLMVVQDQGKVIWRRDGILVFDVRESLDARGEALWHGKWPGAVRPRLAWTTQFLKPGSNEEAGR